MTTVFLCLPSDKTDDDLEMTMVCHRPEGLEQLEAQTNFSKRELQVLYRGFKNVSGIQFVLLQRLVLLIRPVVAHNVHMWVLINAKVRAEVRSDAPASAPCTNYRDATDRQSEHVPAVRRCYYHWISSHALCV